MTASIHDQPWPGGKNSWVTISGGVFVPASALSASPVFLWYFPWDAWIEEARVGWQRAGSSDATSITGTLGGTSKNVFAAYSPGASVALTKQTLHADVAAHAYCVLKGDYLKVVASNTTNQSGLIMVQFELMPRYAGG
jgi:hypothetical protein